MFIDVGMYSGDTKGRGAFIGNFALALMFRKQVFKVPVVEF